jgi:hypothetical protein
MRIVKSLIKIALAKKAFNFVTRKARGRRSAAAAAPAARKRN